MYYRRKIILALLELFDGQIDKIRLQKLLFLFTQKQPKAEYDFIPYRFGCYSYSANADITTMVRKGLLREEDKCIEKIDQTNYVEQLKPNDLSLLQEVKFIYGVLSSTDLMKHTYINFPFYAINSEVAETILAQKEFDNVIRCKPNQDSTILFTIGYEGISLEEYLVRLLKNNVKLLVDVRNNPLSMKFGFSKSQIKKYCESIGVQYIHFPEVGIQSAQRQSLNSQSDYDALFKVYCENNLTKTTSVQLQIFNLLKTHKRIALTCFELNICQCHRKHLAEAIAVLPGFDYEVKHI